jgi:hypothetical protein
MNTVCIAAYLCLEPFCSRGTSIHEKVIEREFFNAKRQNIPIQQAAFTKQ